MHLQYTYLLLSKLTVEMHYFWNLIGSSTWHIVCRGDWLKSRETSKMKTAVLGQLMLDLGSLLTVHNLCFLFTNCD